MLDMNNNESKQTSKFQQKIKDKLSDAKKNIRVIQPELKAFLDMLYKENNKKEPRIINIKVEDEFKQNEHFKQQMALALGYQLPLQQPKQEEQREYEYFLFFFFLSKDGSERKSIYISTKNKKLYSIAQAFTEFEDINVFMSISTFFPRYNSRINCCEIRRIANQSAYTNVLIADLDIYKTERFQTTPPKQAFEILKQENQELFNKLSIVGVMSGNGLQLYCYLKTSTLPIKEQKVLWKALSQKFNDLFTEYGTDKHCSTDVARVFRMPNSYNCKKDKIKVELLTDIPTKPNTVNEFLTALSLKRSDLNMKPTADAKKERALKKKEQRKARRLLRLEALKQEYQNAVKGHYIKQAEWKTTATKEELEEHNQKSQSGKKGKYNLYLYQSSDLLSYLKHRNYEIEGYRHNFLFIFTVCHRDRFHNMELTLTEMQAINNLLQEPLPLEDIEQLIISVYTTGYQHLTNEFIKIQLDMSEEETEQLSLCYSREQHLKKERERWKNVRSGQRREKRAIAKEARRKRKAEKEQQLANLILDNWDMSILQLAKNFETGVNTSILYKIKAKLRTEQSQTPK